MPKPYKIGGNTCFARQFYIQFIGLQIKHFRGEALFDVTIYNIDFQCESAGTARMLFPEYSFFLNLCHRSGNESLSLVLIRRIDK